MEVSVLFFLHSTLLSAGPLCIGHLYYGWVSEMSPQCPFPLTSCLEWDFQFGSSNLLASCLCRHHEAKSNPLPMGGTVEARDSPVIATFIPQALGLQPHLISSRFYFSSTPPPLLLWYLAIQHKHLEWKECKPIINFQSCVCMYVCVCGGGVGLKSLSPEVLLQ